MKRSFSFTEKPVLFILKLIPRLLPGIEKAISVYWSSQEKSLSSTILRNDNGEYFLEPLQISDSISILTRFRSENAPYTWLRNEGVPFEVQAKEKVQLNIFNEQNNNILVIRIKNTCDSQNDLLFIYFNQNLGSFGVFNSGKMASTESKTIIAHLVRNAIMVQLEIIENDRNVYATLNENTRGILQESGMFKQKITEFNEWKRDSLVHLCNSFLKEISLENSRNYRFTDSAIEKIREFDGEVENLRVVLEKAARYADTMALEAEEATVPISDFHIYFVIEKKPDRAPVEMNESSPDVPVKYLKTLILLDRMEQAAKQLKSRNKLLTSQNLGNEFPNPVTPPAISDALRKHKSKILYLFKEYPSRWQLIRNEFRPIQNILFSKPDPERLTA